MIGVFLLLLSRVFLLTWRPKEWPTNSCPNADPVKYQYSILSMSGVVIHWFTLGELAVLSTQVSAFLLVCSHVMADVVQFLTALSFLILMFGSAITILCRECSTEAGDFTDMVSAVFLLVLGACGLLGFSRSPALGGV